MVVSQCPGIPGPQGKWMLISSSPPPSWAKKSLTLVEMGGMGRGDPSLWAAPKLAPAHLSGLGRPGLGEGELYQLDKE